MLALSVPKGSRPHRSDPNVHSPLIGTRNELRSSMDPTARRPNVLLGRVRKSVMIEGRLRECADLIERGVRLLDIGCGAGWLSDVAIRKGFGQYVGVDRHSRLRDGRIGTAIAFVE